MPDTVREVERNMMRDAADYGLSPSDVSEQMQELEAETRREIRQMEPDVRQQIRGMEDGVWEELGQMQNP